MKSWQKSHWHLCVYVYVWVCVYVHLHVSTEKDHQQHIYYMLYCWTAQNKRKELKAFAHSFMPEYRLGTYVPFCHQSAITYTNKPNYAPEEIASANTCMANFTHIYQFEDS